MTATRQRGLDTSIWAPTSTHRTRSLPPPTPWNPPTAAASPAQDETTALARAQALQRFEQACGRLRWKFVDLENAYRRASAPGEWDFTVADAERNFKVDFYEFYAWIEQAVVLLLHVFGTTVTTGDRGRRGASQHAYHHSVLKTLDDATHPLHKVLGQGDVNHALWKAKELRNRWKDAADGRETPPLRMYDLNWIVTETMRGLEAAYDIASQRVRGDLAACRLDISVLQQTAHSEWDWMVEPMDWQA